MAADEFGLLKNVFGVEETPAEEFPADTIALPRNEVEIKPDGRAYFRDRRVPAAALSGGAAKDTAEIELRMRDCETVVLPPDGMKAEVVRQQLVQLAPDLIVNVAEIKRAMLRPGNIVTVVLGKNDIINDIDDPDGALWRRLQAAAATTIVLNVDHKQVQAYPQRTRQPPAKRVILGEEELAPGQRKVPLAEVDINSRRLPSDLNELVHFRQMADSFGREVTLAYFGHLPPIAVRNKAELRVEAELFEDQAMVRLYRIAPGHAGNS